MSSDYEAVFAIPEDWRPQPWLSLPIPAELPPVVVEAARAAAQAVIDGWVTFGQVPEPLPPVMHEIAAAAGETQRAQEWDFLNHVINAGLVRGGMVERAADEIAGILALDALLAEREAARDAQAEGDAAFDMHDDGGAE